MYRLDITYTGKYGDIDPTSGQPCIVVTPIPGMPGVYNYSWITYHATMPADEINGTLTEVWNGINTYVFNVYYGSECWDCFFPARTAVRLYSSKEQRHIFSGRVVSVQENMDNDGKLYKTVECESEMAYFCDSVCDLTEVKQRLADYNRSMNARDVLVTMLEMHHIAAESIAGLIKKGMFPPNSEYVDIDSWNGYFIYPSDCYPTTSVENVLDGDVNTTYALIQDIFVNTLGMDIWITHDPSYEQEGVDPYWQFGYLVLHMAAAGSGHISPTGIGDPITISTNMASLKVETSPTSNGRITRIVPLGGIGSDGHRLDVTSIPQYHEGWLEPSYERSVANEILSITYGNIDKVSLHEDLVDNGNKTDAEIQAMIQELYRRGRAEADALSGGIIGITVQAIDLYQAGYPNTKLFTIGDFHRITNSFFGLDENFRLIKKVTDLAEPWNAKLEFAQSQTTSTKLSVSRSTNTANRIYNVENMISNRLDNTAVMVLSSSQYGSMTHNPNTVYYVQQGDNSIKAYLGDEEFSGGGVQVGSAAILTTSTVEDFTVNREVMIDYSPATKVVYGAVPSFCLINGVYCLIGSFNANTVQTILEHRQYFGDSFSMPFYSYYSSTDQEYTGKVYSYLDSINNSGNWTAYSRFVDNVGSNNLSNTNFNNRPSVTEWFVFPTIPSFISVANISTNVMSAAKKEALLAAGITMIPQYMNVGIMYKEAGVWKYDTNYRTSPLYYRGSSGYYAYPMWTRDEMDFALSISQRVEPVTPTP